MKYFIDGNGYYEGDQRSPESEEVAQRPSAAHNWNGSEWVPSPAREALANIAELEAEQRRRLTPRGDREFRMALFVSAGQTAHPAYLALKAIDDQIKIERTRL